MCTFNSNDFCEASTVEVLRPLGEVQVPRLLGLRPLREVLQGRLHLQAGPQLRAREGAPRGC